ncbi:hypothetical protein ABE65_018370 [Fictibacillus phosphorivorans]|uniref:Uncharacterized protein n=1 Tax=Fictibacillus phosphorivorans TaxID=1221500 RepID=A0A160IQH6_9BACL|nr:hypothetical protein [Fictibacillus phosphorivorans]ANC78654.1 hypothetical protein ABE65_018370 [Fictibacillus phosphorivorans]
MLTSEYLNLNKTKEGTLWNDNVVLNSNGANSFCNFYYSQLNSIQAATKPKPMTVHFIIVDQGDPKYIKTPNGDDI